MTFKVDLTVTQADAAGAIASPTGLAAGKTRFSIIDSSGAVQWRIDADGLTHTFTGVESGTFTAHAQLLDTAGADLGKPVSVSFIDATATFQPFTALSAVVTAE